MWILPLLSPLLEAFPCISEFSRKRESPNLRLSAGACNTSKARAFADPYLPLTLEICRFLRVYHSAFNGLSHQRFSCGHFSRVAQPQMPANFSLSSFLGRPSLRLPVKPLSCNHHVGRLGCATAAGTLYIASAGGLSRLRHR